MDDLSLLIGVIVTFFGLTAWYLNRAFSNIDKKFEAVDKKFEAVDKKFDIFKAEQNRRLDDFRAEQNKRLDDFKDFFKEILKTEFHYIHKEQASIRIQLTNHVTQTDQRIQNIEDNQKTMQKDLSEIKDLLRKA